MSDKDESKTTEKPAKKTRGWGDRGKLNKFGRWCERVNADRDELAKVAGVTTAYVSMLAHSTNPGRSLMIRLLDWAAKRYPETPLTLDVWR